MTGAREALGGPTHDLLLAYRGTAYFLRFLSSLPERAYDDPGHPDAPTDRRTTIATVGYDARGWATLVEGVREQRASSFTLEAGEREAVISLGATLPPRALRHLVEHSAVHLAVEWRDLPARGWSESGTDGDGNPIAVENTPWLRARQTWLAAVDLGTGGSFFDFPASLLDRLISEEGGTRSVVGGRDVVEWHGEVLAGSPSSIARRILRQPTQRASMSVA